jgi:hypothetical protein
VIPIGPLPGEPTLLNLEIRGVVEQSVIVSSLDAVSCLCPELDVTFVHRGRVLCPALTFGFLRIHDGDQIFALSKGPREQPFSKRPPVEPIGAAASRLREQFEAKFSSRFRDPDSVFEGMRAACDTRTAREAARLTDLFRTRVEEKPNALRSLMGRIRSLESKKHGEAMTTVLPEKAVTPSTELLPMIWRAACPDPIA